MINARLSRPEDKDDIYRIWKECFGDTTKYIDGFFNCLGNATNSLVIENEKGVFGMAHLIPLGELVTPNGRFPCAVTYALGVSADRRGGGGGALLSAKAIELAEQLGFVPVICPAEPSLFDYYGSKTCYKSAFYFDEASFEAAQTDSLVCEIGAEEYLALREELLSEKAHIALLPDIMKYQQKLCCDSGGGLYKIDVAGEIAVAAVERWDAPFAKELLSPSSPEKFATALARHLNAPAVTARFPGKRPFAMAAAEFSDINVGWFGFAFD